MRATSGHIESGAIHRYLYEAELIPSRDCKSTTPLQVGSHRPGVSFIATTMSCSDARYRSVVRIYECPGRNLICSFLRCYTERVFA